MFSVRAKVDPGTNCRGIAREGQEGPRGALNVDGTYATSLDEWTEDERSQAGPQLVSGGGAG
jgi:hypothetical protein